MVSDDGQPRPLPRAAWAPLPRAGCVGVEGKVLLHQATLVLALLRFAPHGTIDAHAAPFAVDVVCLEGSGYQRVGDTETPLRAGEGVRWPAGQVHRLWSGGEPLLTLMVEHRGPPPVAGATG